MRRLALSVALLAWGVSTFAQFGSAEAPPAKWKPGFDAITIDEAKTWLGYLAGPECEGRGTGQPGYQKAAEYVAEQLKSMGVKPMGDNGTYFQMVYQTEGTIRAGTNLKFGEVVAKQGEQFGISSAAGPGDVKGELVLLQAKGGDSKLPENLKDKIVIVDLSEVTRDFRRQLNAAGAAAVIEVNQFMSEQKSFRSPYGGKARHAGRIHPDLAAKLFGFTSWPTAKDGVSHVPTGKIATLNVDAEVTTKGVPNVVGVLEGSDPKLKSEYVAIGAHLDHLGVQERNGQKVIYWGADDDGSGSTAVLGVARAMSKNPVKPKRSTLFLWFMGEEMGLIGSSYYAENPTVPLNNIITLLQMDMVGRDADGPQNGNAQEMQYANENRDTIRLVGSQKHSTELHSTVLDINKHVNFKFRYDREDVYTRSDHYVFAAKGIPICFYFDGFHPDYHEPTDTIDKINFLKVTNAAKLCYLTAATIGDRENRFTNDLFKPSGGGR